MKLLIYAAGIKATGVTQVTVSFIRECIKYSENKYFVLISPTVDSQLDKNTFPPNFVFEVFDQKPFFNYRGLKNWFKLIQLEKKIKPDCVFSIFGPSVWKPNAPHLMGYAYPYYIYPESPYFKIISYKRKFIIKAQKIFHKYYLERNGEYYVSETEDVTARLPSYIKCNKNNLYTVTNTYNDYFNRFSPMPQNLLPERGHNEFRFLTLSSFTSHKNLTILNEVIPILLKKMKDFRITYILSIDENLFKSRFVDEVRPYIYNLGRINVKDCPQAYYESDAMFLPTLMECFSASYAEAMKMGKPIITSDLPFAVTVCDDAALYFNPLNPYDIADKTENLIKNRKLQADLIEKGYRRLSNFETAASRAEKYLKLCEMLSKKRT